MKARSICFRLALLLSGLFISIQSGAVDIKAVEEALTGKGLEGWVHGTVADKELYVFTYRNPDNFFDYITMSLVPATAEIRAKLAASKRHDKLRITGSFMPNPSPQKHISVTAVEVVKDYKPAYEVPAFVYSTEVPKALRKDGTASFLVHAIGGEGHILVVEYQDQVVPIFARDTAYTAGLSRNDVIRLKYKVQEAPNRPRHLMVDDNAKEPVKMVERIADINEKPADVQGTLVMFPKSPEIIFNVFAVLQDAKEGYSRQFTIVNFENPEVFKAAREKLQAAWDAHPGEWKNGRNKLVSTKVRVRVKGNFNQVSVNQANPQVLIGSADDITILE
jgi:hypothetical protein